MDKFENFHEDVKSSNDEIFPTYEKFSAKFIVDKKFLEDWKLPVDEKFLQNLKSRFDEKISEDNKFSRNLKIPEDKKYLQNEEIPKDEKFIFKQISDKKIPLEKIFDIPKSQRNEKQKKIVFDFKNKKMESELKFSNCDITSKNVVYQFGESDLKVSKTSPNCIKKNIQKTTKIVKHRKKKFKIDLIDVKKSFEKVATVDQKTQTEKSQFDLKYFQNLLTSVKMQKTKENFKLEQKILTQQNLIKFLKNRIFQVEDEYNLLLHEKLCPRCKMGSNEINFDENIEKIESLKMLKNKIFELENKNKRYQVQIDALLDKITSYEINEKVEKLDFLDSTEGQMFSKMDFLDLTDPNDIQVQKFSNLNLDDSNEVQKGPKMDFSDLTNPNVVQVQKVSNLNLEKLSKVQKGPTVDFLDLTDPNDTQIQKFSNSSSEIQKAPKMDFLNLTNPNGVQSVEELSKVHKGPKSNFLTSKASNSAQNDSKVPILNLDRIEQNPKIDFLDFDLIDPNGAQNDPKVPILPTSTDLIEEDPKIDSLDLTGPNGTQIQKLSTLSLEDPIVQNSSKMDILVTADSKGGQNDPKVPNLLSTDLIDEEDPKMELLNLDPNRVHNDLKVPVPVLTSLDRITEHVPKMKVLDLPEPNGPYSSKDTIENQTVPKIDRNEPQNVPKGVVLTSKEFMNNSLESIGFVKQKRTLLLKKSNNFENPQLQIDTRTASSLTDEMTGPKSPKCTEKSLSKLKSDIIIMIKKHFPNRTDEEIKTALIEIRNVNGGKLSGLSFKYIANEVKKYFNQIDSIKKLSSSRQTLTENSCPICFENWDSKERNISLRCKHTFHSKCIKSWLKQNNVCPMCRVYVIMENK